MTTDISSDNVIQDFVNVDKWRQYSITFLNATYTKKKELFFSMDLENSWVSTHLISTLLGYDDHEEIGNWRELILEEVGQYIDRTERFRKSQSHNLASQ